MSTTFGVFKKIEQSEYYCLDYLQSSQYMSESLDDDCMIRDITLFNTDTFNTLELFEEERNSISLLAYSVDNEVTLHPDINSIELSPGQLEDPVDGVNIVIIDLKGLIIKTPYQSAMGRYFLKTYPTGFKRKRARNADGTFKADDPSTPNINEAWENVN